MTQRAAYLFSVKEYGPEDPQWIMLEPRDGDPPLLKGLMLGLDFVEGTSMEEATELARMLNDRIRSVSVTDLRR